MDEAGIDAAGDLALHAGNEQARSESAVRLARHANDALYEATRAHPDRFAGFAELPMPDPAAAAAELERTVTRLRLQGRDDQRARVTTDSSTEKEFWPVFERAEALDVPVVLPSGDAASGGDRGLLQGLPGDRAIRLGLHGRDRNPGGAPGHERHFRQAPAPQDHSRSHGRDVAVRIVAHRPLARPRRGAAAEPSATISASIST